VEDGVTGWLVRPRDANALAAQMLSLLELPARQQETIGKAAEKRAREMFDERIVVSAYKEVISLAARIGKGAALT
jgi:glycosyltransferase involved in cell wall biosynthesis